MGTVTIRNLIVATYIAISGGACTSKLILRAPTASQTAQHPSEPTSFNDISPAKLPVRHTIEDYLALLKTKFPEYFNGFSLVYDSRSVQESDYINPRAIVFGTSGRLIITFNGSPKQKGYAAIETMEYSNEFGFRFREIGFAKNGYKTELDRSEIDWMQSTPTITVSKPNPSRCTQCHSTENPRPIFDSYFVWPGLYGSDDDNVFRPFYSDDSKSLTVKSVRRLGHLTSQDPEYDGLISFLAAKKGHARYQILGNPIEQEILETNKGPQLPGSAFFSSELRPNLVLQNLLMEMSFRVGAKELVASEKFLPWRYFIVAGELCRDMDVRVGPPPSHLQSFDEVSSKIRVDVQNDLKDYHTNIRTLMQRHFKNLSIATDHLANEGPNELRYLTEVQSALTLFGFDLRRWLVNLYRIYAYSDGTQSINLFREVVRQELLKARPTETWALDWNKQFTDDPFGHKKNRWIAEKCAEIHALNEQN